MIGYTLSLQAERDVEEIWQYTELEWGEEQADIYVQRIEDALTGLAKNPGIGRQRDEVRPGYRSLLVERHIVFYRLHEGQVEVARILHASMDVFGHSLGSKDES